MNRGLDAARGEYIARMDADDESTRNRLLYQYNFLENKFNYGAVSGLVEFIALFEKQDDAKALINLLENE